MNKPPSIADQEPVPGSMVDDDEISLLDLLLVISENIKLLVLGPLLAGLVALGYAYTITPVFTAKTTVMPPSGGGGGGAAALLDQLGPLAGMAGISGIGGGAGPAQQLQAYLESDTLRDKLIEKYNLKRYYEAEFLAEARRSLMNATKIISDKKSGLISIEVTDKDPKFAAVLANSYVELARERMGLVAVQNAKHQRELLERQIEDALKKPYQSPLIRDAVIQGLIRQAEAARIQESQREGPLLTQVDVAQAPELKSGPKKALIAVIATLATGFALLLFVFVRQALRNSEQDAEAASKLRRIKASLTGRRHLHD